jgi:hypothetical protein
MKKWIFIYALGVLIASARLFAGNVPIQRIDVANLLSNTTGGASGASVTSVVVDFLNGGATPCFTTTLAFQGTVSIWAGIGQTCIAPITSIAITPLPSALGLIYDTPASPFTINGSFYSAQITIIQGTAPTFDPNNGALVSTGALQTTMVSHFLP